MIAILTRRPTRRVWAAALLAAGVLATPLAPRAHAAFGACRSDPIVRLSNGVTVDLTADISTSTANVQKITYTLHGPVGTTVTNVTYTQGLAGPTERFTYLADEPAGQYDAYTVASTTGSTAVTATTTIPSKGGASASGLSGASLHVHLSI